jgi:dipeptidyl aminopeptidase/acylaminoacyl peptidase
VRQPAEAFGSIYIAGAEFATIATGVMEPVSTNVDLSADGELVVFVTSQGLTIVPVDGRRQELLLLAGTPSFPRWSPDDKYVAFADKQGIAIVSADGKVKHAIPGTTGAVSVAWVPVP